MNQCRGVYVRALSMWSPAAMLQAILKELEAAQKQYVAALIQAGDAERAELVADPCARDVRARRTAHVITSRKKPERRRYAVTIIIPNRSTSVGASTAATASAFGSSVRSPPGLRNG